MDRGSQEKGRAGVRFPLQPALCGPHPCRRPQVRNGARRLTLGTTFLNRQELIAQIDKGGSSALAPQLKVEQSTIEGQSLADVSDFERYVVETNRTRFFCIIHGTFLGSPDEKRCGTD